MMTYDGDQEDELGASEDVLSDEIIGVTAEKAAALVGVSERRLLNWVDRLNMVRPRVTRHLSERNNVRIFGFQELIELKVTDAMLKAGLSVRHVHKVISRLRRRGYEAPLSELKFAVGPKGRIYFQHPDGTWEGEHKPDQVVIHQVLDLKAIALQIRRGIRERSPQDEGRIERRRRVHGHKPVLAGTRTPVAAIEPYIERGFSDERIKEAFPHLTDRDIGAVRDKVVSG